MPFLGTASSSCSVVQQSAVMNSRAENAEADHKSCRKEISLLALIFACRNGRKKASVRGELMYRASSKKALRSNVPCLAPKAFYRAVTATLTKPLTVQKTSDNSSLLLKILGHFGRLAGHANGEQSVCFEHNFKPTWVIDLRRTFHRGYQLLHSRGTFATRDPDSYQYRSSLRAAWFHATVVSSQMIWAQYFRVRYERSCPACSICALLFFVLSDNCRLPKNEFVLQQLVPGVSHLRSPDHSLNLPDKILVAV